MRRVGVLFLILLSIAVFFSLPAYAATWRFSWENTTVEIPVGDSIEKYKNIPQAKLFRDGIVLSDSEITYNTEGDWLYYFKDVNSYKVGEYKVWYKAYDAKYSPGTCTGYKALVTFVVVDKIPPVIELVSDSISIHRGDTFDLSKNYHAYDNYELMSVDTIHQIQITKVGTYPVKVIAKDSSNNITSAEFQVIVYEDAKPVISCNALGDEIRIPLKGEYDIASYFTAADSVEGDITSRIQFPPVKNDAVGTSSYTVTVSNEAGMSSEYTVTLRVVDDVEPVLELSQHNLVLDYKENFMTYDFSRFVKSITDNDTINYKNLSISHNLVNQVGSYSVQFSYTDGVFTVTDSIAVTLISYDKPIIEVLDIEIYTDSNISLSDYISVSDPSDPNVAASLEVYDSTVDYSNEGTYYAEAYCINSSGVSATRKFKVVVRKRAEEGTELPIAWIAAAGGGALSFGLILFIIFYFVFKKKIR